MPSHTRPKTRNLILSHGTFEQQQEVREDEGGRRSASVSPASPRAPRSLSKSLRVDSGRDVARNSCSSHCDYAYVVCGCDCGCATFLPADARRRRFLRACTARACTNSTWRASNVSTVVPRRCSNRCRPTRRTSGVPTGRRTDRKRP